MKHKRKLVVGLGAVAMSFGMVATAGTASAGTNNTDYVYSNGTAAGKVWFDNDGDWFYVQDLKADSHGVAVQYRINDSYAYPLLVNNGGKGTVKAFNKDFKEGATVWFRACLTENSVAWDCDDMAWSVSAVKAIA
ncbi:hypothetical protein ACPA54_20615 [Uniformispora flossi]|uniref:hypothetical protein n=1 Tax=Uniformispora flossi TaxID=3390723 RepID=UPI003C2B7BB8